MSLFDGQADRMPERKAPKKSTLKKTKKPVREARRVSVTERYERGDLKFEDVSESFLLCNCNQAPEYHQFPHDPHKEDEDLFNYHRRLRYDHKRGRTTLLRSSS